MDFFSAKDALTLSVASVGAVLGIINTWTTLDKDRPKMKVTPKQAFFVGPFANHDQRPRLCIEVLNLSTFALTVTEVGVLFHGSNSRGVIFQPTLNDGSTLPSVLEPRRALSAYADPSALDREPHRIKCVYAKTDCGLTFKGKSGALEQLLLEAMSK